MVNVNIDLIEEALKKTQNIYSKTKAIRAKYKNIKEEWEEIAAEFDNFFPKSQPQWNISIEKTPEVNDCIITLAQEQNSEAYEFNVLIYTGDSTVLEKYWYKLPTLKKEKNE